MTTAAKRWQPNDLLRQARLARHSPSGSGRPLSRQELAEAANAWLYTMTGIVVCRDADYIKRLERGGRHWPQDHYRAALRAVLGATTDAELGFYDTPPSRPRRRTWRDQPTGLCSACPFGRKPEPEPQGNPS